MVEQVEQHSVAGQPLTEADPDLSPWWLRTALIVLVLGFTALVGITILAYRNAPPIPEEVLDARGVTVFKGHDIRTGQTIFLKYGLMANGSIWGHGGYLGPDFAAAALHRIGEDTAAAIARENYGQPLSALNSVQQAAVPAETAVELKSNRSDPARGA